MSTSAALQKLVVDTLLAAAPVAAIVGARVKDMPRPDTAAPYISIGPGDVVEDDVTCIDGRIETLQLDLWSEAQDGFLEVKRLAEAVRQALRAGDLALPGSDALVSLEIAATRYLRDRDGISSHGVVTLVAMIETAVVL